MKTFVASLALVLEASLIAGCAGTPGDPRTEAPAPKVYRTGSNIPVKDDSPPMTPEERQRAMDQVRAATQTSGSGK
jgi:hypothetical protein